MICFKDCTKCHKRKDVLFFSRSKVGKYNYASSCKECQNEYSRQYYREHKESVLKRTREHHKNTPEYQKQRARKWYVENREYKLKKNKEWAKANPERKKEIYKKYLQTEKGKINNREKVHRRKVRENLGINDLSNEELLKLFENTNKCPMCKRPFNKTRKKTHDHIFPIVGGGGNTLINSQVLCLPCNLKKGTRNISRFNNGQCLIPFDVRRQ